MSEYSQNRNRREDDLIKGLAGSARNKRNELYQWTQKEIDDLLMWTDIYESKADGVIKEQLAEAIEQLRRINSRNLPQAITDTDDQITDLLDGGYNSLDDACTKAANACRALERVVSDVEVIAGAVMEHFDP